MREGGKPAEGDATPPCCVALRCVMFACDPMGDLEFEEGCIRLIRTHPPPPMVLMMMMMMMMGGGVEATGAIGGGGGDGGWWWAVGRPTTGGGEGYI